jgi:hypothetical protein
MNVAKTIAAAVMLLAVGCGSIAPRTVAMPAAAPSAPADAQVAVQVVLKAGTEPSEVAARVAGHPAYFEHASMGGDASGQTDLVKRSWLIPIAKGAEQDALRRAQEDADVEQASLIAWPAG